MKQAMSAQFNKDLLLSTNHHSDEPEKDLQELNIQLQLGRDDVVKEHVDQAVNYCMLKQTKVPKLNLSRCSPTSATSLIDSRGNALGGSGGGSNRSASRFSLLSAAKLNNMLGSMSELPINFEDDDEYVHDPSKTWCFGQDGLHSHPKHDPGAKLAIVSGAHTIGKSEQNEDAYFLTERAFGVADGVSGWMDFGFSSEAFSNELMNFCKQEIVAFDQSK